MAIGSYFMLNYHKLLMAIGEAILVLDIYFSLNNHRLLMIFNGYYISDYWWLNYHKFFCLLVVVLL